MIETQRFVCVYRVGLHGTTKRFKDVKFAVVMGASDAIGHTETAGDLLDVTGCDTMAEGSDDNTNEHVQADVQSIAGQLLRRDQAHKSTHCPRAGAGAARR